MGSAFSWHGVIRRAPGARQMLSLAGDHAALTAFLVLLAFAAIAAPQFYDPFNLKVVGEQAAILGIITVGQSLVLLVRGFDLSVGTVAGVMAMTIVLVGHGGRTPLVVAILMGIALAAIVGLINAWLVVGRGVPPFVATLGVLIMVEGARFVVSQGQASGEIPEFVTFLGRGLVGVIPTAIVAWAIIVASVASLLHLTPYGRALYASGSNPDAALLSGLRTGLVIGSAYVLCSVCAALAGIVLTGNVGYVDQSLGATQNFNLNSIAAAVLGGVAFAGGEGNLLDPVAGVLLLIALANLIVALGLPVQLQLVAQGGVLLLAVMIQRLRRE